MKFNRTLCLCLLVLNFLFTACMRDEHGFVITQLSVDKTTLTEGTAAFKDSIQITSNVSWTFSGVPGFVTVSAASGRGNAKVYLTGPANSSTASLSGSLTLSGGGKSVTINISQSGVAPALSTDSTTLHLNAALNSLDSFTVMSNIAWSISGLPVWANASTTSGTGNMKIYVTASQSNQSTTSQSATISISPTAAYPGVQAKNVSLTQSIFSIGGFAPASLPAGDQTTPITISGAFDPTVTPGVVINGTTANVTSHTANAITVTLPSGASTGPVTVTQGNLTLTSASNFIVTNSWKLIAGSLSGLYNQAVSFVLNGKIYMGLGSNSAGYNNDFKIYDPQTNAWTQGPVVPAAMTLRNYATCFVLNNKAYFGFGSKTGINLNDWWSFDGSNFVQMTTFPGQYSDMGTAFVINNVAYVNAGNSSALYSFDPVAAPGSAWTLVNNSFPHLRYNSGFTFGGMAYVMTGLLNNSSTASMFGYDPVINKVVYAPPVPAPANNLPSSAPTFVLNGKGYLYWNGTYEYDPYNGWTDLHTNLTLGFFGAAINGTAYLWRPDGTMYKFVP